MKCKKGDVVRLENIKCATGKTIFEVLGVMGDPIYDEKEFLWEDEGFLVKTESGDFPQSYGEKDGWYWMQFSQVVEVMNE